MSRARSSEDAGSRHAPSDRERLLRLQARIHRQLKQKTELALGRTPVAIARYEEEFRRDFRGAALGPLDKDSVIERLRAADVSLIADFHADPQSCRTALRLVRDAIRPSEDWWIGIEMIPSDQQAALDRFQSGKLSRDEFLDLIRYEESWGFPFSNYEPLLHWARNRGVPVLALNRPDALPGKADLHERDRWAAGLLTDLFLDAGHGAPRGRRAIVLYGELHVARCHLPARLHEVSRRALGRALRSLSVHQNNERLWWRLARQGLEQSTQALELRRDALCVFSSPPWVRLESLLRWTEGETAPSWKGDDDESFSPDALSSISQDAQAISEFLKVTPPGLDNLTALTLDGAEQVLEAARASDVLDSRERQLVRKLVDANERFYFPAGGLAYLGTSARSASSELAAIHLMRTRTREARFCPPGRDAYHQLVLENAFGFLGSLCLNPRRKCDLAEDHERRLAELSARSRLSAFERAELRARRGALGKTSIPAPGLARWLETAYVGRMLGKRLHQALLQEQLRVEDVSPLFLEPVPGKGAGAWGKRHRQLERMARSVPAEASKTEVL